MKISEADDGGGFSTVRSVRFQHKDIKGRTDKELSAVAVTGSRLIARARRTLVKIFTAASRCTGSLNRRIGLLKVLLKVMSVAGESYS